MSRNCEQIWNKQTNNCRRLNEKVETSKAYDNNFKKGRLMHHRCFTTKSRKNFEVTHFKHLTLIKKNHKDHSIFMRAFVKIIIVVFIIYH